jgi:hypothetical protein
VHEREQEYRDHNFTASDWEEYNSDDEQSDEVLSSDRDHSYSSDDSVLSTDY